MRTYVRYNSCVSPSSRPSGFRWRLADEDSEGTLFPDEWLVERHIGTGEFRGLEFLHVNARSIINKVPASSRVPFRYTINAYRGCSHACAYCMAGDTPILMADGRWKPIADVRIGDLVYGTLLDGSERRHVITPVLDQWSTVKPAFRTILEDGTELITSGDHRFLSDQGWRQVAHVALGPRQHPLLSVNDRLIGFRRFAGPPRRGVEYRRGDLSGVIQSGGPSSSSRQLPSDQGDTAPFLATTVDRECPPRTSEAVAPTGTTTAAPRSVRPCPAHERGAVPRGCPQTVTMARAELARRSHVPSHAWVKGFLAGIFDTHGCGDGGVLRFSSRNPLLPAGIMRSLRRLGPEAVVHLSADATMVALRGDMRGKLRSFDVIDPASAREPSIDVDTLELGANLRVVSIESLDVDLPMYDLTTGTGDFVANGVISHNCFARPTHEYLGLGIGEDFERKIVVKVNAVERLRAELRSPKWHGDHIAMGTNTDPYQHAEGKYHLTRGIVRLLAEARNPFSILTKSTLVLRDLPLLVEAASRTEVRLNLSIGTLDREVWKLTEPGTPPPEKRIEAVRRLNDAGVRCGVLIAPVIPGLSDDDEQIRAVAQAALEAGAVSVAPIALHLRPGIRPHFLSWIATHRPELLPLYRRLFARSSYQPATTTARLTTLVTSCARATGRAKSLDS